MCSSASQTGNVQKSPLGGPENSNSLAQLESYRAVEDTLPLADSILAETTSKVPCLPLVLSSPALNFTVLFCTCSLYFQLRLTDAK